MKQDIEVINGEWLTDHIIGAAQSVLRKQFPYIRGMENTTLGQFSTSQFKREFAQILYTGRHHWILVSNIGCFCSKEVKLYDSLFRGRMPVCVKKQIASLIHEEGGSFATTLPRVQRQNNHDDCGVFANTFLVSLLHGLNPSDLTFDSGVMRPPTQNPQRPIFLSLPSLQNTGTAKERAGSCRRGPCNLRVQNAVG